MTSDPLPWWVLPAIGVLLVADVAIWWWVIHQVASNRG